VDHLNDDRYFSRAEFREIYGRNLPGASFTRLRYFMGVVWQSPTGASEQDGSA
jgi:hypothetical protein